MNRSASTTPEDLEQVRRLMAAAPTS